jgi:predicted metal-dependent hydrolase
LSTLDLFDRIVDLFAPTEHHTATRGKREQASGDRARRMAPPRKEKQPSESQHSMALDGHRVDYKVVRRRGRRGVGLKIDGNGLTVAASLTTPLSAIEGMIGQHAGWVSRKLGEWSQRRITPQVWQTGAKIPFMGESLTLMLETGHARAHVEQAMGHLFVKVRSDDPALIEKAVVTWLKKQALPYLAQRAFHFARLHQLTPPQVFLSSANGRWGSCNSRREVRFSWRLIKARPALIDYVVCHEMAHLRHMNHSAAFWAEVERMCPDYMALKKELDQSDHRFRAF